MGFRELTVWQEGRELAVAIYRVSAQLPKSEDYGITSQIRRAANSIPLNIAEGYGRNLPGSYVQFLRIAKGSLNEVETLLIISTDLGLIEEPSELFASINKLGSRLSNLITKIQVPEKSVRTAKH